MFGFVMLIYSWHVRAANDTIHRYINNIMLICWYFFLFKTMHSNMNNSKLYIARPRFCIIYDFYCITHWYCTQWFLNWTNISACVWFFCGFSLVVVWTNTICCDDYMHRHNLDYATCLAFPINCFSLNKLFIISLCEVCHWFNLYLFQILHRRIFNSSIHRATKLFNIWYLYKTNSYRFEVLSNV